jgi:hypothetical protein
MVTATTERLLTFESLAAVEPGLRHLMSEAKRIHSRGQPDFCANSVWRKAFKPRLVDLVGWGSRNPDPRLHTESAYDIAYKTIYSALPNCRHEGPFC